MGFNNKATIPGYHGEGPMTSWKPGSELDLRTASIAAIIASEYSGGPIDPWPPVLHLANLQLESFTPGNCTSNLRFPVVANATCPHKRGWYKQWLARDPDQEHLDQRYQLIINILEKRVDNNEAADIGTARGDRDLVREYNSLSIWDPSSFIRFGFLALYGYTVGYGYHSEWSVWWVIVLTITGALIFRFLSHQTANGDGLGILYSFDLLIPIIKFDERHYKIQLDGFAKYYFYFHRLAGWLLGSFLIAAITGLTLSR